MIEHENNAHEIVVWEESSNTIAKELLQQEFSFSRLSPSSPSSKTPVATTNTRVTLPITTTIDNENNNNDKPDEIVNMAFHNVDEMPDGRTIQRELYHMTSRRSTYGSKDNDNDDESDEAAAAAKLLPYIFVDGLHLGSTAELKQAISSGELKDLLLSRHDSQQ